MTKSALEAAARRARPGAISGRTTELGRLNLVTPEKVLQGIREVRTGKTFCLSLPLDYPGGNVINPRRLPPVLKPTRAERPAEHELPAAL